MNVYRELKIALAEGRNMSVVTVFKDSEGTIGTDLTEQFRKASAQSLRIQSRASGLFSRKKKTVLSLLSRCFPKAGS